MNNLQALSAMVDAVKRDVKASDDKFNALNDDHQALLNDYGGLHDEMTALESTHALTRATLNVEMSVSNGLRDELDAAIKTRDSVQSVNDFLSEQNGAMQNSAKELKKANQELAELKETHRRLQIKFDKKDKVKVKSTVKLAAKQTDQERKNSINSLSKSMLKSMVGSDIGKELKVVSDKNAELINVNVELNKYITELVNFGATAPQFLGGLRHSKQGVMDFVDLKAEPMEVSEKGATPREVMVQRFIMINKHNHTRVVTRIVGEPGIHTVKVPVGGNVQIDKEALDHIEEYCKLLDSVNGKIKSSTGK